MDKGITAVVGILVAIIGVAIVSVLVSQKSQTPQVLQAAGSTFSSILGTALSPVTGAAASGGQSFLGGLSGGGIGALGNLGGFG